MQTKDSSITQTPSKEQSSFTKHLERFLLDTNRLESSYQSLKELFAVLRRDCVNSQSHLEEKLSDLDFVTSYLDTILHHMSQGILFIDLQGTVTTYNHAAEQALGIPCQDVLFDFFWNHFPDTIFGFSMQDALHTGQLPQTKFINWALPSGQQHQLEIEITYLGHEHHNKSVQGMIILIRNITEIRRLQMLANRSGRMKELGELAALIAHEIRNPLGGIKGFASLLQQELANQPELRQMATHIVEGTDDLNAFVSRVLNYSRPLQPHLETIDLIAFTEELRLHVLADEPFSSHIQFIITAPKVPVLAPIDPPLFKSAMLNLIVNAIQAMPKQGILEITIYAEKEHAIIRVTDNGMGISEEHMEMLFSPLFTTKAMGNGFGLPEVHKIVQAHNGSIEVKSQISEGTTFTIKIPLKI